ncbi:MAG: EamA family transporter [Candidatus Delongbacteria bacterium]|jgi:drug/metabolite transporter (DMT)-like permease|nr:EamA family transporter [Candidatus Delongbacteria bacterium]
MIYLFLAILSSASIAMILKFSETKNFNRYAVTSMNYIVAFSLSLALSPLSSSGDLSFSLSSLVNEFHLVSAEKLSAPGSFTWAIIIGLVGGILYFLGFIFIQKSIRINGVGITGAVGKIGILIPMLLSLFLWKEIPNSIQTLGIIIAISAIILINISFKDIKQMKGFNYIIILLFFIAGFAEFSNKIFEKYSLLEHKSFYLFTVFFSAFWISLFFTVKDLRKGVKITKNDILTGFLVGIPNMFASYFLIMSFEYYKATVAFPIYSSGSILLISIGGIFIFKEKVKRKDLVAIFMIIAAVVLMSFK